MFISEVLKKQRKVCRGRILWNVVSSHDQKKCGDLDRQAMFLIENANNLHNPLILKEVGSGLM